MGEHDNKHEVKIGFLIDLLKTKVENHQHLKPKQIIKLAFMDLLLDDNNKRENKRNSFLNLKNRNSINSNCATVIEHEDEEDSFVENDNFDNDIANDDVSIDTGISNRDSSLFKEKGPRNLMRQGSANHWNDDEVTQQQEEMQQMLKIMQQRNSANQFSQKQIFGSYQ